MDVAGGTGRDIRAACWSGHPGSIGVALNYIGDNEKAGYRLSQDYYRLFCIRHCSPGLQSLHRFDLQPQHWVLVRPEEGVIAGAGNLAGLLASGSHSAHE